MNDLINKRSPEKYKSRLDDARTCDRGLSLVPDSDAKIILFCLLVASSVLLLAAFLIVRESGFGLGVEGCLFSQIEEKSIRALDHSAEREYRFESVDGDGIAIKTNAGFGGAFPSGEIKKAAGDDIVKTAAEVKIEFEDYLSALLALEESLAANGLDPDQSYLFFVAPSHGISVNYANPHLDIKAHDEAGEIKSMLRQISDSVHWLDDFRIERTASLYTTSDYQSNNGADR